MDWPVDVLVECMLACLLAADFPDKMRDYYILLPDNKSNINHVQQGPGILHHIIHLQGYCLLMNAPDTTPRASTNCKIVMLIRFMLSIIIVNIKATVKPKVETMSSEMSNCQPTA